MDEILATILGNAASLFGIEHGFLYVVDEQSGELELRAARDHVGYPTSYDREWGRSRRHRARDGEVVRSQRLFVLARTARPIR